MRFVMSLTRLEPPHQDYIDTITDLLTADGLEVDSHSDEESLAMEAGWPDDDFVTVGWNRIDGWQYQAETRMFELVVPIFAPPALVVRAVHLLVTDELQGLPLADDTTLPEWSGQAAFEQAVADWAAANPTTVNGELA
jgi:hypothetical protein